MDFGLSLEQKFIAQTLSPFAEILTDAAIAIGNDGVRIVVDNHELAGRLYAGRWNLIDVADRLELPLPIRVCVEGDLMARRINADEARSLLADLAKSGQNQP